MQGRQANFTIAVAAALALAVGGCTNGSLGNMFDKNEGGFFSKPLDIFQSPDSLRLTNTKATDMDTGGPVGPDDLVGADGRCGPAAAQAAQPAAPTAAAQPTTNGAVGGMAGELANKPAPAGSPPDAGAPPVLGGVALGMTECQTVQRAGQPGAVNISAGDKGQRQVVLTYLSGPWPGIYHFADGRLKEIDRAPTPPEPAKPVAKKKATKQKPAAAKTSQREFQTVQ